MIKYLEFLDRDKIKIITHISTDMTRLSSVQGIIPWQDDIRTIIFTSNWFDLENLPKRDS